MEKIVDKIKKLIVDEDDYTPSQLVDYLNEKVGGKTSGKKFTHQDIQQYTIRHRLPEVYGGFGIRIKRKDKYIIILSVKGLRKKYGS